MYISVSHLVLKPSCYLRGFQLSNPDRTSSIRAKQVSREISAVARVSLRQVTPQGCRKGKKSGKYRQAVGRQQFPRMGAYARVAGWGGTEREAQISCSEWSYESTQKLSLIFSPKHVPRKNFPDSSRPFFWWPVSFQYLEINFFHATPEDLLFKLLFHDEKSKQRN